MLGFDESPGFLGPLEIWAGDVGALGFTLVLLVFDGLSGVFESAFVLLMQTPHSSILVWSGFLFAVAVYACLRFLVLGGVFGFLF